MKYCNQCGGKIDPASGRKSFCTEECRYKFYQIGEKFICKFCGNEFTKRYRNQLYCDTKCMKKFKNYRDKIYTRKVCSRCGKSFKVEKDITDICEDCVRGIDEKFDEKVPLNQLGQHLFVPGVKTDWYGLVNPSL